MNASARVLDTDSECGRAECEFEAPTDYTDACFWNLTCGGWGLSFAPASLVESKQASGSIFPMMTN